MGAIETLTILTAAAITLALFSYLWRENLAYRIAEHAYIGAACGYGALVSAESAWRLLEPRLTQGLTYWYLTALIGLLYLAFFSRNYFWLYRYPTAIVLGSEIGVTVARSLKTQFLEQLRMTATITFPSPFPFPYLNSAIVAVGVICALFYFYATMEHRGPLKYVSKIGIYFLMGAFGAAFGSTVMARISLLIGRLRFMYFTDPAYYLIPVAIALLIVGIVLDHRKKPETA